MGLLLGSLRRDEAVLLTNGLCQKNVYGLGHAVYRQKTPELIPDTLGIKYRRVEQGMTHDAHVLVDDIAAGDRAEALLKSCRLETTGMPTFYVERSDDRRIFYQIDIKEVVANDAMFIWSDGRRRFADLFEEIALRTGAHVPEADLYVSGITAPAELYNHQLFDLVTGYFGQKSEHPKPRVLGG